MCSLDIGHKNIKNNNMFSVVDNLYGVTSRIYLFNWSGQLNWS